MNTANKTPQAHAPSNRVVEDAGWAGLRHPLSGNFGLRDWIPAIILILFLVPCLSWGDYQTPPNAVLTDFFSNRSKSDETDSDTPTETLACSTNEDNKMKVKIKIQESPSETYEWKIKQGESTIFEATANLNPNLRLSSSNSWTVTKGNLDPAFYTLEVTKSGGFKRKIDFLPLEITVVKDGETETPEDGLVVKKTDTVRYRLSPDLPDEPLLLEDEIEWHWRMGWILQWVDSL